MRHRSDRFFLVMILVGVFFSSRAYGEVELRAEETRVVAEDSGDVLWSIRHPGMRVNADGVPDYPIQGPVRVGPRWYYAVVGDVLEVDPAKGAVIGRTQYPTPIAAVEGGERLVVKIEGDDPVTGKVEEVNIVHVPGQSPGRGLWEYGARVVLRPSDDAARVVDAEGWEEPEAKETRARLRAELRELERRDRTNPFYPGYRGLLAHHDADAEAADAAFARAIATTAPWSDDVKLCGLLYRAERPALAAEVCDRAGEKMKDRGIRPGAMLSLITFVSTTEMLREQMTAAVAAEDFDRADQLAEHMHTLFPMVEASHTAWRILGEWFAENDRLELAEKWHARSVEIESSPITQSFWGGVRLVDLMLLLLAAIGLTLPAAGFAIGLRTRGRAPEAEGAKRWMPKPRVAEVVSVLLVAALSFPASYWAATRVASLGEFASMPMSMLSEGHGAPESVHWLEGLAPSEARDDLLEYARYELNQIREGKPLERQPPPAVAVAKAIDAQSGVIARAKLFETGSFDLFQKTVIGGTAKPETPPLLPMGIPALLSFLLFLLIGTACGRVLPGFVPWASRVIPGATRNARALTPWILMAFFAGSLSVFTPIGSILQDISMPTFTRFYGLESLGMTDRFLSSSLDVYLPWVLLLGSLTLHVCLAVLEYRAEAEAG